MKLKKLIINLCTSKQLNSKYKDHLIEKIESRNGTYTIYEANKRGIGY